MQCTVICVCVFVFTFLLSLLPLLRRDMYFTSPWAPSASTQSVESGKRRVLELPAGGDRDASTRVTRAPLCVCLLPRAQLPLDGERSNPTPLLTDKETLSYRLFSIFAGNLLALPNGKLCYLDFGMVSLGRN